MLLVMDSETVSVFLPNREDCYERLRRAKSGATVAYIRCGSDEVIKKGTTGKDAQQYYCNDCETYFDDSLGRCSNTTSSPIEELFYMLKETRSVRSAQIARDPDRDYEAVLNFVHEVHNRCNDVAGLTLSDVCEADEIYVTAGGKGIEQESPRSRGISKKDKEPFNETNRQS